LITALYLAHLNPVTNAHVEIIKELKKDADIVKVMPVIFRYDDREVNSKSFPFNFETRKKMLESIFGDSIKITDDYAFVAPFKKYLPPLIRRKSWKLRKQILDGVKGDYFSYTGDKAEGYMLKMYRLKPKIGERKSLSAASVKEKLYDAAIEKNSNWKEDVPKEIVKIIEEEWKTVEKYSSSEDMTTRVVGMKFPKEGWSKKNKSC
jgi:nicotinic acid mononucleotide adenylyltransferase